MDDFATQYILNIPGTPGALYRGVLEEKGRTSSFPPSESRESYNSTSSGWRQKDQTSIQDRELIRLGKKPPGAYEKAFGIKSYEPGGIPIYDK
jgi:hypothetical protein